MLVLSSSLRSFALLLALASATVTTGAASAPGGEERLSMNGEWSFAADYRNAGDTYQWFATAYPDGMWDRVKTPHVWSMDPRYPYYVGVGWYRRRFTVAPDWCDRQVRLVFEAVYARSRVWLNGQLLAEHEGGYTPFEIDLSPQLQFNQTNLLVVRVDNWPEGISYQSQPQLGRAWMEDGGIIRDAYLVATPKVFVTRQKIEAVPDLAGGSAVVRLLTRVRNVESAPANVQLAFRFLREEQELALPPAASSLQVPAGTAASSEITVTIPREQVRLWGLDKPVLYRVQTTLAGATNTETFGIRKFEARGTELLLNGKPVRLAGGNRIASATDFGQNDPAEAVERDLRLMKEAGLEFMRMHHVPLSRAVLDWADRHGLLLIEECSHATPPDLDSEPGRASFRSQLREMLERDWNRPSVVAWSVGNEFASETPAGLRWVKDMSAQVRALDGTRLVCFASNRAAKTNLKPEEEGSSLTDFVCLNTYGATPDENAANIDRAHQRWPDKPMIITEFGQRADRVGTEADRELWFAEMFRVFRERPFLSGASVWSFNDYRSRYVSTNPDGYRWWGLVDASRKPRGSYALFRREFTPLRLAEARFVGKSLRVKLAGRSDFPVYPPTDCQVHVEFFDFRGRPLETQTRDVVALAPGAESVLQFPLKDGVLYFRGEILRGEFSMMVFGPTTWSKLKE